MTRFKKTKSPRAAHRTVISFLERTMDLASMGKVFFIVLAVIVGFSVRCLMVLRGYESFNSDEVLKYRFLRSIGDPSEYSDFINPQNIYNLVQQKNIWAAHWSYAFSGGRTEFLPFFACLVSVLFYLVWFFVVNRRTGSFWAAVPLLAVLAFPPPDVAFLGTNLTEFRFSFFYGALLICFAGKWFRGWRGWVLFGVLSGWGCWEDFFTLFFILPVALYEWKEWKGGDWSRRIQRLGLLFLGGALGVVGAFFLNRSLPLYSQSYVHWGLGSPDQWWWRLQMLLEKWPAYWVGEVPWSYLQDSALGRFLDPPADPWVSVLAAVAFWPLLFFSALGAVRGLRKKGGWREVFLWLGPPILMVLFFLFGGQTHDLLSLRYLSFWQVCPFLFLGLWAAFLPRPWKDKGWMTTLGLWLVLNANFLGAHFLRPVKDHPGQRIATRLEAAGYHAGFANYWVSEVARYFSRDRVLLAPFDHLPLSRRATQAAQGSQKIALVWVQGLDRPDRLPEISRQLESLGYRRGPTTFFELEGWSITEWEKKPLGKKK